MEDAGSYYCKGNNSYGEETQTFQLNVMDGALNKVLTRVAPYSPEKGPKVYYTFTSVIFK